MKTIKELMTYHPPEFRLFQQEGMGYLYYADLAVIQAESAFYESRARLRKNPDWGSESAEIPQQDLVEAYGYWTKTDDLLKRLSRMPESETKKHLDLDTDQELGRTFEKVMQRHAELTAEMILLEEDSKDVLLPAIDRQLKRRLETFRNGLVLAEKTNFKDDGEPFQGIGDFCSERDVIEYAGMGILNLQRSTPPRLVPLPYLYTYLDERLRIDKIFRQILKGRYAFALWAELPQFWWHHSPADVERAEKKK